MLETTVAGSLPKPSWLAEPEKLCAAWRLDGDDLAQGKRDATLVWIKEREDAGIDIVLGGEQSRVQFVRGFLKHCDRIYPCTNCGLAPPPDDVSIATLPALGAGVRLARKQLKMSKKKSWKSKSVKKGKGGKGRK